MTVHDNTCMDMVRRRHFIAPHWEPEENDKIRQIQFYSVLLILDEIAYTTRYVTLSDE